MYILIKRGQIITIGFFNKRQHFWGHNTGLDCFFTERNLKKI